MKYPEYNVDLSLIRPLDLQAWIKTTCSPERFHELTGIPEQDVHAILVLQRQANIDQQRRIYKVWPNCPLVTAKNAKMFYAEIQKQKAQDDKMQTKRIKYALDMEKTKPKEMQDRALMLSLAARLALQKQKTR